MRIDLCLSITSIALCFLARHSPRPPAPDRPPAQHIHRRQHRTRPAFAPLSDTTAPLRTSILCIPPNRLGVFSFWDNLPLPPGLRGLHLFLAGRQGRRDCE